MHKGSVLVAALQRAPLQHCQSPHTLIRRLDVLIHL